MDVRSSRSSSDGSFDHKLEHKHNDYSCYINLINNTESELQLIDSKATSGTWAKGSCPKSIKPNSVSLIELTDPKGPRGSEGSCKYRLYHPAREHSVTFKLEFADPYWGGDDNFLRAYTQYSKWISLSIPKYKTSGHPFVANVEVNTLEYNGDSQHRASDASSLTHTNSVPSSVSRKKSLLVESSLVVFPDFEPSSPSSDNSSGEESSSESRRSTHSKTDSAVVLVYDDDLQNRDESSVNIDAKSKKVVKVNIEELIEDLATKPQPGEPKIQLASESEKQAEIPALEQPALPTADDLDESLVQSKADTLLTSEQIETMSVAEIVEYLHTEDTYTPEPMPTLERDPEPQQETIPTPAPESKPKTQPPQAPVDPMPVVQEPETQPQRPHLPTRRSRTAKTVESRLLAVMSAPQTKLGAIAVVFLASYGYTFARISGGLALGFARWRRS